jgi:hypothetical protein
MIRGRKDRVFAARFCWDQNELRPIGEAMETDPINFLRSHSGSQVCIGDGVESNSERILKEIVTEVEFSEANRKESFGHALLNLTEQKIITSNKLGIPNLEPLYLRAGGPETWDRAK